MSMQMEQWWRAAARMIGVVVLIAATAACTGNEAAQSSPYEEMAHGGDGEEVHWSYSGETGPQNWGTLKSEYITCLTGSRQSPINITETVPIEPGGELVITYQPYQLALTNTGHSIQVNVEPGHTLTFEGQTYELLQFHSHTPSEHQVKNQIFPMEWHFVHQNEAGELLVLGVLGQDGDPNPAMSLFWDYLPQEEGTYNLGSYMVVDGLMPADSGYYTYEGSLTTPPCSEGVRWIVLKNPITVSQAQVEQHRALFGDTARPVQLLQGRTVYEVAAQ